MDEANKTVERKVEITEPIFINLGNQKRKRIKRLLRGRGKLWNEVEGVIEEVTTMLEDGLEDKTVVPLVLIYRRKPKRKRSLGIFGF
jgi:hypothetical protein